MTTHDRPRLERVHDILRQSRRSPLEAFFAPRNVAVIGATETAGSVGRAVMENLALFEGAVFPVHPTRTTVLERPAFVRLKEVPEKIDLAIIATPAHTVPGIIRECVDADVAGAVILSAGFRECGAPGVVLERDVLNEARRGRLRVIGPNCLGIMAPNLCLNASFATGMARPGNVAFLSQSGALCAAILDWSIRASVGFSAFVSIGSMLDVGWGDLIYHLGDDPQTKSIVIYMESIGDARSFLSAAREVALTKPIIVLKVGRTEAAARAAASHTGSLTGGDEVLDAAFRRAGVLRVDTISELFSMAEVLGKQPRPRGPRLAIITNAGGPGALATDMLVKTGGRLAELSKETLTAFNEMLPPFWSHNNPIDILGDAKAERFERAVELAVADSNNDGLLVTLTPQAMTESTRTAEVLKKFSIPGGKPILASWMGGPEVDAGRAILHDGGIPVFEYPDTAAATFSLMWRYSFNLSSLYETPATLPVEASDNAAAGLKPGDGMHSRQATSANGVIQEVIDQARRAGRTLLTEYESKRILAASGIATVETHIALSEDEAVARAQQMGFPVVLKLHSESITHKAEVGGVKLSLSDASEVRDAWKAIKAAVGEKAGGQHFQGVTVQPMVATEGVELILGSSIDPQFGPVLLFGAGGRMVEIQKDRALGLPPLNTTLARRMMEQTRIHAALQGTHGHAAVDLPALEQLLVRFSRLISEHRWIKELDINPLLVSPRGMLALDARVVLHGSEVNDENLPKLAIRPYPSQYASAWKMKNDRVVNIRPIGPEDEPLMIRFHQTLSDRSVYNRYFTPLKLDLRVAHERLARLCFIDYDREMALVVEHRDDQSGRSEILGIGRLSKLHGAATAEFAITIGDPWQKCGLGTELLRRLVQIGRTEGLERIIATILPENHEMQQVCRKAGFEVWHEPKENEYRAEIKL